MTGELSPSDALWRAEYASTYHGLTRRRDHAGTARLDDVLAAARAAYFAAGGTAEGADGIADEAFESALFHSVNA